MKLAFAAALVVVFVFANVVAGGVFLVLGPLVPRDNDMVTLGGFALVGLVAVGCALLFTVGALRQIPRFINRS